MQSLPRSTAFQYTTISPCLLTIKSKSITILSPQQTILLLEHSVVIQKNTFLYSFSNSATPVIVNR